MNTIRNFFIRAILIYTIAAVSANANPAVYFSRISSTPYGSGYSSGYGYGYGYNGRHGEALGYSSGTVGHASGWSGQSGGSNSGSWYGQPGGWAGHSSVGYGGGHSEGWHGGHSSDRIGSKGHYAPLYPQFHQPKDTNADGHYDSEQVFHVIHSAPKKCSPGEKLINGECKKEEKEEEKDEKKGKVNIYFVCPSGFTFIDGSCIQPPGYQPYEPPYQPLYQPPNLVNIPPTQNCPYTGPCGQNY